MKISNVVCATTVVAIFLTASRFCSAQDKPLGDVAREARAQKSEAHHAKKAVTNDDLSSDRGPVQESDDPVTVVREAWPFSPMLGIPATENSPTIAARVRWKQV